MPAQSISRHSYQAAHANAKFSIPLSRFVRQDRLRQRGTSSLLHLLPNDAHHDSAFHCRTILCLRVGKESPQPFRVVLADDTRHCRRFLGRCGCCRHKSPRCCQDALADEGLLDGPTDP